jgi:NitT/TauT family transport system ATP-binding protein
VQREAPVKLEARGVALDYDFKRLNQRLRVLERIDLQVFEREFLCIVGPSGCGKSSFLSAVDGLTPLTRGQILIDGRQVTAPGPDRAVVFQNDSLFPWRTVLQNVMYGTELHGRMGRSEMIDRARWLVDLVRLRGFENHYPGELSGGMRQRVNLARALAPDPALVLMDEPFAALDAQTREFMQIELLEILDRARKTAIFITHQIDEAIFLADRVAVFSARPAMIKDIVAVELGAPRTLDLKRSPRFAGLEDRIWRLIEEESRRTSTVTMH